MRDYKMITSRVEALGRAGMDVRTVGAVEPYPFYCVGFGDPRGPEVLLTAGVHGDEPAGVEALFAFIESDGIGEYGLRFRALPCVNPTGYVARTRENADGVDVNRAFEDGSSETRLVAEALGTDRFVCAVDLHEDWEATGFYLYESDDDEARLGEAIIDRVRRVGKIDPVGDQAGDDEDDDDGNDALSEGVYAISESWGLLASCRMCWRNTRIAP